MWDYGDAGLGRPLVIRDRSSSGLDPNAGHARMPDPQAGDVGQGVVRSGAHAAILEPAPPRRTLHIPYPEPRTRRARTQNSPYADAQLAVPKR